MTRVRTAISTFVSREEGAALVEYALLVALIAAVCVLAVTAFGAAIRDKLFGLANDVFKP